VFDNARFVKEIDLGCIHSQHAMVMPMLHFFRLSVEDLGGSQVELDEGGVFQLLTRFGQC
jgi:hypothetical protein